MKFKSLLTAIAPMALLFTSCLKSHNSELLDDKGSIVTAIADVGPNNGERVVTLNALPATETLDFITLRVYAPGNAKPSGPVHVKLATTAASGYDPLPVSGYSLQLDYDIPAGTNELVVPITLVKPSLDLSKNYGIQVSIASVSQGVIAENDKTMVVAFAIKNAYDGVYSLRFKHTGWLAYGIADGVPGTYPLDISVVTAGSASVTIDAGPPFYDLLPGFTGDAVNITGATAFGATTPKFIFDPVTNALTNVINTTPDDGRGRFLLPNPAVTTSRYDPSTKKIYASFIMTQIGRPNQIFYDTLTYLRPR